MLSTEEIEVLHAHNTYSLFALLAVKEDGIQAWVQIGYSADRDEEERISIIKSELGRSRRIRLSAAYIARTVQSGEYLLLVDGKVVAGPFPSAAEAIRARDELVG